MTNSYTDSLTRQLQQLIARIQSGTGATGAAVALDFQGETPAALSPQQVLGVIQGDSEWVRQFERQLERQFEALSDRVLQHWLEHTDRQIRDSLKEVAAIAIRLFQPDASAQEIERVLGSGDLRRGLNGAVANAAGGLVQELLTRNHTHREETARSKEEAARFKASRGQVQAELSSELARGRRYQ